MKAPLKSLIIRVAVRFPFLGKIAGFLGLRGRARTLLGLNPVPEKIWPLVSVSPHNLKLYEYLLTAKRAEGFTFITSRELYGEMPLDPSKRYILIRHDLDYAPERLVPVIDIERRLGIRSDIDVVISGQHYDPAPYVAEWRKLAEESFAIGVHTVAPQEDDFFSVLRKEIETFQKMLGFPPRTFSIHGVCPSPANWKQRRMRFLERIGGRLESFGFTGSHNIGGISFWVEDSGRGGEFSYICRDFIECEPEPGQVMGMLMHPDHWLEWPIGWVYDAAEIKEHPELLALIKSGRPSIAQ